MILSKPKAQLNEQTLGLRKTKTNDIAKQEWRSDHFDEQTGGLGKAKTLFFCI